MTTLALDAFRVVEIDESEPMQTPGPDQRAFRAWPFFMGGDADGSAEYRFAVDDLIHEGSMVMIYGPQGCLKTPEIMDIGAHVRLGKPFQNRRTTPGCMIYIAAEGVGAVEKRVAGIDAEHPDLPSDWIVCFTQAVNLMSEDEARDFAEFVVETIAPLLSAPVRIIAYDTMAKSTPGESDSNDDTISRLEANARIIAQRVAEANEDRFIPSSLFAHHPRKNDGVYRGSGSIEGNFDTVMKIDKTDAEKLEDRLFEVSLEKVKDGPTDQGWAYRAHLVHVGTTASGKENYAPVVRYIGDDEAVAIKAEAKTKGRSISPLVKHLIELIVRIQDRDGVLERPRNALAQSGYLDHVKTLGWDWSVRVNGVSVESLHQYFQSEELSKPRGLDGSGRGLDDDAAEAERIRGLWRRRLTALKNSDVAWVYAGWIWLTQEERRTGVDGE